MDPFSGKTILTQLKRSGSNLDSKHEVSFWLYFPDERRARQAARWAEETGLTVEVSSPLKESEDSQWLCLLYCPHIPDESLLDGVSQFCVDLALEFNGKFPEYPNNIHGSSYLDQKTGKIKEISLFAGEVLSNAYSGTLEEFLENPNIMLKNK